MERENESIIVVAHNICNILNIDDVKRIAADAYVNNVEEAMPLILVLASETANTFILAIYLLFKCCVPTSIGVVLLENINDQLSVRIPDVKAGEEIYLLTDIILKTLSPLQLRQFVNDIYRNDLLWLYPLVERLYDKNGDDHLRVASLIIRYAVPTSVGQKILITERKTTSDCSPVEKENDLEDGQAIASLCESLSDNDLHIVMRNLYMNNVIDIRRIAYSVYRKTNNRFYKAIWLLMKYKVFLPNGIIILERIDVYCRANKNKYYIDLCIYKDIFGAIKAGVSNYRNRKVGNTFPKDFLKW